MKTSSIYRGVSWSKRRQRWMAYAYRRNRQIKLGQFVDEHEAGAARRDFDRQNPRPVSRFDLVVRQLREARGIAVSAV